MRNFFKKVIFCLGALLFLLVPLACSEEDEDSVATSTEDTKFEYQLTDVFSADFVHPKLGGQILMVNLVIGAINTLYALDDSTKVASLNHTNSIGDITYSETAVSGLNKIVTFLSISNLYLSRFFK